MDDQEEYAAPEIEPWKVTATTYPYRDEWLSLRSDNLLLPNGKILAPYHTIESPDWVNVIAISDQGNIILVEQYRHGAKQILLELPAGNVDPKEKPESAMRRELLEETGYVSDDWRYLGALFPAAARLTNQVHSYLALGARKLAEPAVDESEILRLREMPWEAFAEGLRTGSHMLLEANQLACVFRLHLHAANSGDEQVSRFRL